MTQPSPGYQVPGGRLNSIQRLGRTHGAAARRRNLLLRPAAADGAVGVEHVAAGALHLGAVRVGLLVDHLEIAAQLGNELLAGHRTGATPEVTGGKHITNDRLVLSL